MRSGGPFYALVQVEPRLRERTLTVNGVSKVYSMTGGRIGYAGGRAWLIRAIQTLQSQSTSNPSTISQAATLAALEGGTDFLIEWIDELRTCRDPVVYIVARCPGLRCDAPHGEFYAFVDCSGAIGALLRGAPRSIDLAKRSRKCPVAGCRPRSWWPFTDPHVTCADTKPASKRRRFRPHVSGMVSSENSEILDFPALRRALQDRVSNVFGQERARHIGRHAFHDLR